MFIKSLRIGFIGLVLSVASVWAASVIQGTVKDANGRPIKGADIRIETTDGSKLLKTVKTDGNGRYISDGLSVGAYRVTLVVDGAVKASITNTKTESDQPTQLNFDLKPVPAAQAAAGTKNGKHKVWMPARTGSHVAGYWVEVDDKGNAATAGMNNVETVDGAALRKAQVQGTRH